MLAASLKASLEKKFGQKIMKASAVGGGCISEARQIELEDGRSFFLKYSDSFTPMFEKEAHGLEEISKAQSIRVPKILEIGESYLLLEFLEGAKKSPDFWEVFGKQFAEMHKFHSDSYGFREDNYIGLTPQKNTPSLLYKGGSSSWCDFYFENRLLYQLKLAEKKGYATSELTGLFAKLEKKLPSLLEGSEERPSLLHGDLWSGNYLVGPEGQPYLIDPAVYYGHREADLAMTKLFGGFAEEFYKSYQRTWPLVEGWEYREGLYKLYHVMNHLNLFGRSYYGQAIDLLRSYL